MGLVESVNEHFPDARWQRCAVHFYRSVFSHVPRGKVKMVAHMLKAIHASEDLGAAREKGPGGDGEAHRGESLVDMLLNQAGSGFPAQHWRRIRTNNPLERIIREIRRRTRVVGAFPDGESALMLVATRLRHIATTKLGTRCYLKME